MMVLTSLEALARTGMNGAIAMGYLVVSLFFISYWRETRQRLFVYFTTGFLILSVHRSIWALTFGDATWDQFSLALRLVGYLVILAGIIDRRMSRAPA